MKIVDPGQKYLIASMSKVLNIPEQALIRHIIEMGFAWCLLQHTPFVERIEMYAKLDKMFEEFPEAKLICKEVYLNWKAGGDAIRAQQNQP